MPCSTQSCSYRTLYLSIIANTHCASQMPKTHYCGLQSSTRICKYALITPLLVKNFVKRNLCKKRCGCCTSSTITIIREIHVNLFTRFLMLDNKQLLSNMIAHEATQVPYNTKIYLLADSYIFCSNFPAILCINAIASYIAIWRQSTFEQKLNVASYIARFLAKW